MKKDCYTVELRIFRLESALKNRNVTQETSTLKPQNRTQSRERQAEKETKKGKIYGQSTQ